MEIKILNNKYSQYINSYYVTGGSIEIVSNNTNKSNTILDYQQKINVNDKLLEMDLKILKLSVIIKNILEINQN